MRTLALVIAVATLAGALPDTAMADQEPRMDGGFFLRFGLGVSAVRDLVTIQQSADSEPVDGVAIGIGTSVEWNLGWVVDEGIALGLYIVTDTAQRGQADFGDLDILVSDAYNLNNVGLFLTYYPAANGPWHMTGGVGVGSTLSIDTGGDDAPIDLEGVNEDIATGFGAFFGGGYEWRLTRRWALGASGRVQVINGSDVDETTAEHRSVGFAALGTLSFN